MDVGGKWGRSQSRNMYSLVSKGKCNCISKQCGLDSNVVELDTRMTLDVRGLTCICYFSGFENGICICMGREKSFV